MLALWLLILNLFRYLTGIKSSQVYSIDSCDEEMQFHFSIILYWINVIRWKAWNVMRTAHAAYNFSPGFVLHLNMSKARRGRPWILTCCHDYCILNILVQHAYRYLRSTLRYLPLKIFHHCCFFVAIQSINYPSGKNEQLEEFCKQTRITKERIWYEWRKIF